MKRILGLPALAALFMAPCMAQAEGGQIGLYVAPRLIYGGLMGHDMKREYSLPGFSGTNKYSMDGDNVFGGGIAVGYDFHKRFNLPLRAEMEYAAFSNAKSEYASSLSDSTGSSASSILRTTVGTRTLFMNAYYDFRNNSKFTPYFGLGLGWSFLDMKGKYSATSYDPILGPFDFSYSMGKKTTTNFAWNVGGGVAYAFTGNLSLDLAYRFARLGKGKTKDDDYVLGTADTWKTGNLDMHQLSFGLRYGF
jgi:opacity protein-like surface antigen